MSVSKLSSIMITRRDFLTLTTAGVATSLTSFAATDKKKKILGVQLFSIPKLIDDDLPGTLKLLGSLGYKEVEFFGPYSFSAPEVIEGWKETAAQLGFKRNAFYGYTPAEVKKMLDASGLAASSVHLDLTTLRKNMNAALDQLAILGTKYVALPALRLPGERSTLDGYKKLADEFNTLGEKMSSYKMVFTYHNHGYEHAVKENEIPMNVLLERTNARYVAFEMDIFWMAAGGAQPVEYLKKYPGRFKLMHLKNAAEPVRFTGDGGSPDQWMALFPKMADPEDGVFDIPGIVKEAVQSGVEHFYLERDLAPDPQKTLKNSAEYLKKVLASA